MDDRTGKIYDSKAIEEKFSEKEAIELKQYLVSITEKQAIELKELTLKERLGWLAEFKRKNAE